MFGLESSTCLDSNTGLFAVKVVDDDTASVHANGIYSWSLIAAISSSSSDKHNTPSNCVAVPVATVTSLNPPRACSVPTSGPSTSVRSRALPRSATRVIRVDLTSAQAPLSSSSAAAAAARDAALNQHRRQGMWFEEVSVSTG